MPRYAVDVEVTMTFSFDEIEAESEEEAYHSAVDDVCEMTIGPRHITLLKIEEVSDEEDPA